MLLFQIDYIGTHHKLGGFALSGSVNTTNKDPSTNITCSQNEDEEFGMALPYSDSDIGSDHWRIIELPNEVIDLTLHEEDRHNVSGIDEGGCSVEQDDNEAAIVLADSDLRLTPLYATRLRRQITCSCIALHDIRLCMSHSHDSATLHSAFPSHPPHSQFSVSLHPHLSQYHSFFYLPTWKALWKC